MERINRVTHNFLRLTLVATVLSILAPKAGFAQINMQQLPSYPSGATTRSQGRADAASTTHGAGLGIVPEDFAQLKLAPGFLLGLNVLDDSDFQGEFRIDEDGNIELPTLGNVRVAGETAPEARAHVRAVLVKNQILKDPQVTLTVLEYTAPQVTIVGEVAAPGKYPLLAPHKLVDVLALAGGPTVLAGNEVRIVPATSGAKPLLVHYSKDSNPKSVEDVFVDPGDTVQVKRAGVVYVLGAVNRPGGYVMQEEGTLNILQAVSLANGTSIAASTGTVYLLHRNADGTEVDIALPYKKISRGKAADVQLHATDILYVPTSAMKAILINSQGIISSAASASIYAVAVH